MMQQEGYGWHFRFNQTKREVKKDDPLPGAFD